MAATDDGGGYWKVAADGGASAFGCTLLGFCRLIPATHVRSSR
jgi:hypothetical protein